MGKNNESRNKAHSEGYQFTKNQLLKWGVKYHELKMGKPSYEIIFDDETQQAMFFEFVSWLKKNYDGETIGERLYQHIEMCLVE